MWHYVKRNLLTFFTTVCILDRLFPNPERSWLSGILGVILGALCVVIISLIIVSRANQETKA